jgi:ribonuclease HII
VTPEPFAALFAELARLSALSCVERELEKRGYGKIAGVDEVGRGCLAGPVAAGAVVLPRGFFWPGIDDSKKLMADEREAVAEVIRREAVCFAVAFVPASQIDQDDVLRASLDAMRKALQALHPEPEAVLIDAVAVPRYRKPQIPIVHGDGRSVSIAAASILAKVERDRAMTELAKRWPAYGFEHHKGYGTPEHWEALRAYGPCPEHRLTYRGVEGARRAN